MRIIELMLGGIIVVSTLVDIFQSVVVPRPTRGSIRLAPFLLDGKWPLWKWIAFRFPLAKYRTAFLGYHAPLTVVMLLLVWGIALILGYGLLFLSGCQLANDLKDYFKISPAQAQAGNPKKSFEEAYTRLKSAGFCLADPEPALASFIVLRSAYADALHSLMKYWVVSHRKF